MSGYIIRWIYLLITFLITIFILGSCKKDSNVPAENNKINITKTGCKTEFLSADSLKQDCIEYQIIDKTLHIKHINAAFNCCPNKVYAISSISFDTIIITEKEILTDPCKCNCLYDIEYDIPNITDSIYIIKVNEPYIQNNSDKLIFTINTHMSSSGLYCSDRDIYPWN